MAFILGLNVLQHELTFLSLKKSVRAYQQGFLNPSPGWVVGEIKAAAGDIMTAGWSVLTTPHPGQKDLESLPALKLYVPQSALARLNKDLPDSGRQYVKAELAAGGRTYRAKVKYRGDNMYHWGTVQKSWRVKLKKGRFYDGMRSFNLINPFALTIQGPLVWTVGQRMGGLHLPKSYPVNVFLNGNYLGVFSLLEQINEYWARQNDLLPGDIYYGEGMWSRELNDRVEEMRAEGVPLEEIKAFRRARRILWNTTDAWDKNASVSSETEELISPRLEELLRTVMNPDGELFKSRIWELIDREILLRSIALHLILDSKHTDDSHNWKLYLNPYTAKFEPVLWNLACLQYYNKEIPADYRIEKFGQLLYDRAMADPLFLSDLCRFIHTFVWQDLTPGGLMDIFDRLIALVRPAVRADEYKDHWVNKRPRPLSNREFERIVVLSRKRLEANLEMILSNLEEASAVYSLDRRDKIDRILIRFKGRAGLILDQITLTGSGPGRPDGRRIYLDSDNNGVLGSADRLLGVSEDGTVRFDPLLLLSNRTDVVFDKQASTNPKLYRSSTALPTHCRLLVIKPEGRVGSRELKAVRLSLRNRATGEAVSAQIYNGDAVLQDSRPMVEDQGDPGKKIRELVVFKKGLHLIKDDRVYGKEQDLVFEAGAIVELEPGTSIISHGSLEVRGRASEPVVFRSFGGEPWGVLAVQSPRETVVVEHLRMSGGSEEKDHPVYYSGMLSVYDGNLEIKNSTLEKNHGEDGINVKNGKVLIKDCLFTDLKGDAIDLDRATGRVERSIFRRIKNDAMDFGGSKGEVVNILCSLIGDKSISVGERSSVRVENLISRCVDIGVAVKDESKAEVLNSLFVGNRENHSVYRKNLHFAEAGRISLSGLVSVGRSELAKGSLTAPSQKMALDILAKIHGPGSPLIDRDLAEIREPACAAR